MYYIRTQELVVPTIVYNLDSGWIINDYVCRENMLQQGQTRSLITQDSAGLHSSVEIASTQQFQASIVESQQRPWCQSKSWAIAVTQTDLKKKKAPSPKMMWPILRKFPAPSTNLLYANRTSLVPPLEIVGCRWTALCLQNETWPSEAIEGEVSLGLPQCPFWQGL